MLTLIATAIVPTTPAGAAGTGAAEGGTITSAPIRNVVILSLPTFTWADLQSQPMPALRALLHDSAVADLSTRTVRARTEPSNGYVALGAGARAVADSTLAGQNLDAHEPYGNASAGEVFTRRTGRRLFGAVGVLGIASIKSDNQAQPFDTVAGALGSALRNAGVTRRVVANADEDELESPSSVLHREAVLTLADATGRVRGAVTDHLLTGDPDAPFGLRLDIDRVVAAATDSLRSSPTGASAHSVLLVEASDLARADAYRSLATPAQRDAQRAAALVATDHLVARILEHVDLKRDAVLVVGPYHGSRRRELTALGLHAPGVPSDYLTSGTTRRAGFVQIVDIAPTILDLLRIERPESMEGRPVETASGPELFQDRIHFLARVNREALFRDETIGKVTATLIIATLVLTACAILGLRRRRRIVSELLTWASLAMLGFLVGTFIAGIPPFDRWGTTAYFVFLSAFALVFAGACKLVGRRGPADPIVLALGAITTVHVLDALTGAHLELNTVFGYTGTVGIRLAGLGNPGSAQLCASALLCATLLAWRFPSRAGFRFAMAMLAVVVVAVGAPMWGQDFGGAISAAPAYLLLGLLLSGRKITARAVALLAGILVAAGILVGLVDLARPANGRTHVGRFFEKIGNEGISGFTTVIGRKLGLMLGTFSNTGYVLLVLGVLGAMAVIAWKSDWPQRIAAWIPATKAGIISFAVLIVLATILNDSGIQVTGMMLAVLVPTIVFLACRVPDVEAADPAPPHSEPPDSEPRPEPEPLPVG